jgi:hypothetical protein
MLVPNRYHHSKKEQKRKLKPQALRQAKARLSHFKKRHMTSPKKGGSSVLYIHTIQLK